MRTWTRPAVALIASTLAMVQLTGGALAAPPGPESSTTPPEHPVHQVLETVEKRHREIETAQAELEGAVAEAAAHDAAFRYLGVLEAVSGENPARRAHLSAWADRVTRRQARAEKVLEGAEVGRRAALYSLAREAAGAVHHPDNVEAETASLLAAWQQSPAERLSMVLDAARLLGMPYQFGRSGPGGYDCSGLVVALFQPLWERVLPHKAASHHQLFPSVPLEELQVGDLVFFAEHPGGTVGHVALHIGAGMLIHATAEESAVSFGRFRPGSSRLVGFANPFPATTG